MPFSLELYPAGEKMEGRANVMDKIEAQTWFSCSIYHSRSEVLSEILGNVKNSDFVRAKKQLHFFSCLNTKLSCFLSLKWVLVQQLTSGAEVFDAGQEFDPKCFTYSPSTVLSWRASLWPFTGGCSTLGCSVWCSGTSAFLYLPNSLPKCIPKQGLCFQANGFPSDAIIFLAAVSDALRLSGQVYASVSFLFPGSSWVPWGSQRSSIIKLKQKSQLPVRGLRF